MKLKFGIIGCGNIAKRHAECIGRVGTLIAVCDIVKEKASYFGNTYGAQFYESAIDLLNEHPEIDIITICSPNGLHATHAINALKKGFHVLCEKPMALTVKDCEQMIKEAELSKKLLLIVKQNRFNPPVIALKQMIDNNRLGELFSVQLNCFWNRNEQYYQNSWRGTLALDGGTLFTQFSHFIDLLIWMIGDVQNVHAFMHNYNHKDIIEFEDTGVVILKFFSGVVGTVNFTINSFATNMEGSITIFGKKGAVKVGGQYLNKLEYQSVENFEIKDLSEGNIANQYEGYAGSMSNHELVYDNLISLVNNKSLSFGNGAESLKTVKVIEMIYAAYRNKN